MKSVQNTRCSRNDCETRRQNPLRTRLTYVRTMLALCIRMNMSADSLFLYGLSDRCARKASGSVCGQPFVQCIRGGNAALRFSLNAAPVGRKERVDPICSCDSKTRVECRTYNSLAPFAFACSPSACPHRRTPAVGRWPWAAPTAACSSWPRTPAQWCPP